MANILKMSLLRRIANRSSRDSLIRLFSDRLEGRVSDVEFEKQAREILASGPHFGGKSQAMTDLIRQTQSSYQGGQPKNPVQSEALAETVYQKAINRLHLADYQARGTRLVQVRAIMDSKTTEHCKSMHGRIFRVGDLVKEDHNQRELVRPKGFWGDDYFQGTPTYEVIPGIPPYHFGCRTRLVPYTDAKAYESFDSMAADHPLYATILKDKLQNYEIGPDNLPGLRDYAGGCEWKEGSLEHHFGKHGGRLGYESAAEYDAAAFGYAASESASILLRIERDHIIMYAYTDYAGSEDKRKLVAVFDLSTHHILSFSFKKETQMDKKTEPSLDNKSVLFDATAKQQKKLGPDGYELPSLKESINDYRDIPILDIYMDVPRVINEYDIDEIIVWGDDISDFRMSTIEVLIGADWLPEKDREEIKKVDDFILANPVPKEYMILKEWLKAR